MKIKKFVFFSWFVLFFPTIITAYTPFDKRCISQYIFLIDTSGSMVGLPPGSGNQNIFRKVKTQIISQLQSLPPGSHIVLMPFHRGIQDVFEIDLHSKKDVQKAINYINELRAEGQVTWIYLSLYDALQKARQLFENSKCIESCCFHPILLYTDGHDNGPPDVTLEDVLGRFQLLKSDNPYLLIVYYTLGIKEKAEVKEKLERSGIQVIEAEKGKVPDLYIIHIRPSNLNFGNIFQKSSVERKIQIFVDPRLNVSKGTLTPQFFAKEFDKLGIVPEIDIIAEGKVLKSLPLKNGVYTLRLRLHNVESLPRNQVFRFSGYIAFSFQNHKLWNIITNPKRMSVWMVWNPGETFLVEKTSPISLQFDKKLKTLKGTLYFQVRRNLLAKKEHASLRIYYTLDHKNNPNELSYDFFSLETTEGVKGKEIRLKESGEVSFNLHIPIYELLPGIYQGKIYLIPSRGTVEGPDIHVDREPFLPFSFQIPKPLLRFNFLHAKSNKKTIHLEMMPNNPTFTIKLEYEGWPLKKAYAEVMGTYQLAHQKKENKVYKLRFKTSRTKQWTEKLRFPYGEKFIFVDVSGDMPVIKSGHYEGKLIFRSHYFQFASPNDGRKFKNHASIPFTFTIKKKSMSPLVKGGIILLFAVTLFIISLVLYKWKNTASFPRGARLQFLFDGTTQTIFLKARFGRKFVSVGGAGAEHYVDFLPEGDCFQIRPASEKSIFVRKTSLEIVVYDVNGNEIELNKEFVVKPEESFKIQLAFIGAPGTGADGFDLERYASDNEQPVQNTITVLYVCG